MRNISKLLLAQPYQADPITCGSGGSTGQQIADAINLNTTTNATQDTTLADHESRISTNESNISQNTSDIAQNASDIAQNVVDIATKMEWKGPWVSGLYNKNDVVTDDGWLMIANQDTIERPAPQPIGFPTYVYDGTIATQQITAKQVIFGSRYSSAGIGYVTGMRIYTIAGNEYDIYTVNNPLGTPTFDRVATFVANSTGWYNINLDAIIIGDGTLFDLIAIVDEPDPTPTTFSGDWNYTKPQNAGIPGTGVIIHANTQLELLQLNKIDNNAVDRSSELASLTIGDVIEANGLRWAIQNITDQGAYIDFQVIPAIQLAPTGILNFTFETITATPITYAQDTDYNLGNSQVRGLYAADLPYSSITVDDNQYGIDIQVQQAQISLHWDALASSQAASSGGGSGFVFYSDALNSTDDTQLANIGTTWVQGAKVDIADTPAGQYIVGISFTYGFPSTTDSAMMRFSLNGGAWEEYQKEAKDIDDRLTSHYEFPITHNGGPLSIDTQFQKTGGAAVFEVFFSNAWLDQKTV